MEHSRKNTPTNGHTKVKKSKELTEVGTLEKYQSPEHCSDLNKVTLLESWVKTEEGHFIKNQNFFPQKIGNNLKAVL
jgi:hypothetical protein